MSSPDDSQLGVGLDDVPQPAQVAWLRQLVVVARKDALMLWRRPALLFCLLSAAESAHALRKKRGGSYVQVAAA